MPQTDYLLSNLISKMFTQPTFTQSMRWTSTEFGQRMLRRVKRFDSKKPSCTGTMTAIFRLLSISAQIHVLHHILFAPHQLLNGFRIDRCVIGASPSRGLTNARSFWIALSRSRVARDRLLHWTRNCRAFMPRQPPQWCSAYMDWYCQNCCIAFQRDGFEK